MYQTDAFSMHATVATVP